MSILSGLRKVAPFAPPVALDLASDTFTWGKVQVLSAKMPAIPDCDVSDSLALDWPDTEAYSSIDLHPPEFESVDLVFGPTIYFDGAFDLLAPLVTSHAILLTIDDPSQVGSTFEKNDEESVVKGAKQQSVSLRPSGHRGFGDPANPKGFDLFAMLLPILIPPARTDFREELLFPGELYGFQRAGVKWLFETESALLADDMGLGKTVQAITAFRALVRRGLAMQALVVCPKSLLTNWSNELKKWAPELTVAVIQGNAYFRQMAWKAYVGKCHVLITTYDSVRSDKEAIQGRPFDVIIGDEVQLLKNPSSGRSQAIRQVKSNRRWGLTGTPLENKVEDLAAIFLFLVPGLFSGQEIKSMNYGAIHRRMERHFLRRRKQDVDIDLPEIMVNTTLLELNESQRKAYERAEKDGIVRLQSQENVTLQHVLALIGALKQICNFDPETGDSCKVDFVVEDFLPQACVDNQKALIVSQYVKTLEQLSTEVADYYPLKFDGGLSTGQRDVVLKKFQDEDTNQVLLLSLKAGGVGLTLTRANYLLHFDRWWNPAVEDQATARIHRIGQTRSVFIFRLVCKDTIEERIEALLENKRILFSQVVDELADVDLERVLSEEELFGLFGLQRPSRRPAEPTQASVIQIPKTQQNETNASPEVVVTPTTMVVQPSTPYSNQLRMREVIRECDKYLDWVDPHFAARALEEISIAADPARINQIRLLSSPAQVDEKARSDFKRFRDEMKTKGIVASWRILKKTSHLFHDRLIISATHCWNVPPVNSWLQGSYAQINKTTERPPFDDWWSEGKDLFDFDLSSRAT